MQDLTYYKGLRDKAIELTHIHKKLDTQLGQDPDVRFILYEEKIVLEIDNLKVLPRLRKAVKTVYPKWQDKIESVWESPDPNYMLTSWQSKQYSLVEFWLECPVGEYPESLIKSNCKIVTERYTGNRSYMLCGI